jgi:hypothetical protein
LDESSRPVAGARVGIQGATERVNTDESGRFSLQLARPGSRITAWKRGFFITGEVCNDSRDLTLRLRQHPGKDDADYEWLDPSPDPAATENCANCHAEIYRQWTVSNHARSAENRHFLNIFYGTDWLGRPNVGWNFRSDQPDARAVCSACHLPTVMATSAVAQDPARATGVTREGIHCDFCHKIADTDFTQSLDSIGLQHGRDALRLVRPAPGQQVFFGPLDDVDRGNDTFSPLYRSSYSCAGCHEGTLFGVRVYETFTEWLASPYAQQGVECQSCHMKPDGVMKNVAPGHGGIDRDPATLSTHHFPGSTDHDFLRSSVDLTLAARRDGNRVFAVATVRPIRVGHRLPTGSPDRHMILVVRATNERGDELARVQGPTVPEAGGIGPLDRGYLYGMAGKLYGKVLRGPGDSVPAPFWQATSVDRDSRLYPDQPDETCYTFEAADDSAVQLSATLIYRRFFKVLLDAKSWPDLEVVLGERHIVLAAPFSRDPFVGVRGQ